MVSDIKLFAVFGLPIDLAHRLYNSLLLPHKPWLAKSPEATVFRWVRS